MLDVFDVELMDCEDNDAHRFLAEFTWTPQQDEQAKACFDLWSPKFWRKPEGGHRYPTMRASTTHGYYLVGSRTFWAIGWAKDKEEIDQFCKDISQGHLEHAKCYWCKKIKP